MPNAKRPTMQSGSNCNNTDFIADARQRGKNREPSSEWVGLFRRVAKEDGVDRDEIASFQFRHYLRRNRGTTKSRSAPSQMAAASGEPAPSPHTANARCAPDMMSIQGGYPSLQRRAGSETCRRTAIPTGIAALYPS